VGRICIVVAKQVKVWYNIKVAKRQTLYIWRIENMMLLIAKRLGFEFITFFILATIYYKLFHKHEKWFKQSIKISLVLSIIWTILYCLDMVVFR